MEVKFKPAKAFPEQINVKVSPHLKDRHDLLSRKLRVDVSEYYRQAIDKVLSELEKKVRADQLG